MKRAIQYKTFLILFFLPLMMVANNDNNDGKGKYKKEKTIKKKFNVNSNALIKIDNSYGNLDVVTWDENRIEFEITITTSGNNEEKVQKKLDEITVDFDSSMDMVSAKTIFSKSKSKSWWNWSNNNNVNMKINYIVKMPVTNSVDLNNDYGSINLAKLEGRAILNCDYGKITTKELLADDNRITFDYSNNCFFEYIKSAKINADYSGFTISKANKIDLVADYTKSKIEIVENVSYNCDYGGLTVEKANNVRGNGNYLTVRLGDIYKDVFITADYGSIRIDKLTKNAGNVTIDSDYVGIKMGYAADYAFDFDIDLEYGNLKDNDDTLEITKKRVNSSDKHYSGYHKSEGSGNLIKINSEYGSVSFNKL